MIDKIRIQVQYIMPIKKSSYVNMPKQFIKKSDHLSKKFSNSILVKLDDINTRDKLGFVIRKFFGFGTFNILFFNKLNMNKNFNKKFKCLVDKCPVYQKGACNHLSFYKIYKYHEGMYKGKKATGYRCKMNPKLRPSMCKRARVTITPALDVFSEKDYSLSWDKRHDKMYYMRWFFKENRKRRM